MTYRIIKNNTYGFFEVENKPTESELNDYYAKKYYQTNTGKKNQYQSKYTQQDIDFINNKIENKYELLRQHLGYKTISSFVDIGCGEGFALNFFSNKGIEVLGVDFSNFGIQNHNPSQITNFRQGNVLEVIDELIAENKTFDVVWVDNVLEHVIDPEGLMQKCYQICSTNGFIIFEVPNDFSKYQKFLLEEQLIKKHHWEITPDHLNYFSPDSLTDLCKAFDFELKAQITDFPIQLFLLNDHSNYYNNPTVGKQAHNSRILFEKYIKSVNSNEQILKLYQTLLESGFGRQIIGLYQKK